MEGYWNEMPQDEQLSKLLKRLTLMLEIYEVCIICKNLLSLKSIG